MAAFYRTSEGYAQHQGSHTRAYFKRLLAVLESVITQPNPHILEIGAGSAGAIARFVHNRSDARAVAMELSPASLRDSRAAGHPQLSSVAGNALQLPFRDGTFDVVMAFEVVEHLPDVSAAFAECLRVVRRPGTIVIGLPNHASLWTPLEDGLRRRTRLAFGVDGWGGAWRWWKRNAMLAWRKRLSKDVEFLYREPILNAAAGGDADAVYYAAPIDLLRFFRARRAELIATSADLRLGRLGRFVPVELQGSTVMAWRINDATG